MMLLFYGFLVIGGAVVFGAGGTVIGGIIFSSQGATVGGLIGALAGAITGAFFAGRTLKR